MAHRVRVRLDLHERALRLEHRDDLAPRVGPVHPAQPLRHAAGRVRALAHRARLVDDDGHRQPLSLADLEVVRVVRRRDLHDAGAERGVGVRVRDDRDLEPGDRQAHREIAAGSGADDDYIETVKAVRG